MKNNILLIVFISIHQNYCRVVREPKETESRNSILITSINGKYLKQAIALQNVLWQDLKKFIHKSDLIIDNNIKRTESFKEAFTAEEQLEAYAQLQLCNKAIQGFLEQHKKTIMIPKNTVFKKNYDDFQVRIDEVSHIIEAGQRSVKSNSLSDLP